MAFCLAFSFFKMASFSQGVYKNLFWEKPAVPRQVISSDTKKICLNLASIFTDIFQAALGGKLLQYQIDKLKKNPIFSFMSYEIFLLNSGTFMLNWKDSGIGNKP